MFIKRNTKWELFIEKLRFKKTIQANETNDWIISIKSKFLIKINKKKIKIKQVYK